MAKFGLGTVALGAVIGAAAILAVGFFWPGHGPMQQMMHQSGMMGNDVENMPGLRGGDVTPEETAELGRMFADFQMIDRRVENLPNGIKTITGSRDPAMMDTIAAHVMGMINRVETARDPQVFIQSPTLDILFERGDTIVTEIAMTDEGIVVTQTSDDPEVVAALQTHAGEVSDLAARGMEAVHDQMARQ